MGKGHKVRSQQRIQTTGRSNDMKDTENIGAGKMTKQVIGKAVQDPAGYPVDKVEPFQFRCIHLFGVFRFIIEHIRIVMNQVSRFPPYHIHEIF